MTGRKEWWTMDTQRAFEAALEHYRKGEHLLNYPEAVPMEEQSLHSTRATAHFAAGSLALALGLAQDQIDASGPATDSEPPG
jgi:hypothetical protein